MEQWEAYQKFLKYLIFSSILILKIIKCLTYILIYYLIQKK
jgi:hypothetical protein